MDFDTKHYPPLPDSSIVRRDNFFVLTGGSGTGKSTLVEALGREGYPCVREVGRQIVQEQLAIEGGVTPWDNPLGFRALLFERSVAAFQGVEERERPVFFDRGICECIGYSRFLGVPVPDAYVEAARLFRYAPTVFVTPPWQEIFENDPERPQSWDDAVRDYEVNAEAYAEAGYTLVEVPRTSVEKRVAFVLDKVGA